MPTISDFTTTTTRAAVLGYRVLIVCPGHPQGAPVHVELIDAASGRTVAAVGAWAEVGGWLDAAERMMSRKKAA